MVNLSVALLAAVAGGAFAASSSTMTSSVTKTSSMASKASTGKTSVATGTSSSASTSEDLFPTNIGFGGEVATSDKPMLRATDPYPGYSAPANASTASYAAPAPFETNYNITQHNVTWAETDAEDESFVVSDYWAQLKPYESSPGFGVAEFSLPPQCRVSFAQYLHRHGARYPSGTSDIRELSANISNSTTANFTGPLSFLNDYEYRLGEEILTPVGNEELFSSGVDAFYRYGHLWNTSKSAPKLFARTTSEDRMLHSAIYFLLGFAGLDWREHVDLLIEIEDSSGDYNNTLVSYYNCPNSDTFNYGTPSRMEWASEYLQEAAERLQNYTTGFTWDASAAYAAQELCPYEANALGYSAFCDLFTQEEWKGYEYSYDLEYNGWDGFGNPAGRALGLGWVQELTRRLTHTGYNASTQSTENSTLDSNPETFPLDNDLYFDFTHDGVIVSVMTALGLTQFQNTLPLNETIDDDRTFNLAHLVPFAARMIFEVIECDEAVYSEDNMYFWNSTNSSSTVSYMHVTLNDRTIPLGASYPECGNRSDGWCALDTFTDILTALDDTVDFEYACYGDYNVTASVTSGMPPPTSV